MSEVTTNHKTIRKWAESHGGKPAAVDRTHQDDDIGIIRIMFPKSARSEHDHLVEISWDEFFQEFDERKLALIYDQDGMFSKLVSRDSAKSARTADKRAWRVPRGVGGRASFLILLSIESGA